MDLITGLVICAFIVVSLVYVGRDWNRSHSTVDMVGFIGLFLLGALFFLRVSPVQPTLTYSVKAETIEEFRKVEYAEPFCALDTLSNTSYALDRSSSTLVGLEGLFNGSIENYEWHLYINGRLTDALNTKVTLQDEVCWVYEYTEPKG